MGTFDSVYVKCPSCGERLEFQSKAGPCSMGQYDLEDAPAEVLADINRDSVFCDCGFQVAMVVKVIAYPVLR